MPALKDVKNKINGVRKTKQITKAMNMVASAKLRGAQTRIEQFRSYAERFKTMLHDIAAAEEDKAHPLLSPRETVHSVGIMLATSDRGLCGGFNTTIVRLVRAKAAELLAAGKTVKILTVGKKGREQLRRDLGDYFVGHVDMAEVKRVGYANAQDIAREIFARFEAGEFDVATIFFNRFQSVISQIPTAQQIIPAQPGDAAGATALYDYEPSEEAILADLLPRGVATQIFTALLENGASEQGARMSAMDNATRNAGDMINRLTIQYNRSRQAAITKELIEIISGAEAL